jgi:DNA-binding response OmpR family regulator
MNSILNSIVFYILIVDDGDQDHNFLRHIIHAILPQAIIESVHNDSEIVGYFNNCTTAPHLIFLNQKMLTVSGKSTLDMIKNVEVLSGVPIVFLSTDKKVEQKNEFIKQAADEFKARPYQVIDLEKIVRALDHKWLA